MREQTPPRVREWMSRPPEWLEIRAATTRPLEGLRRDAGEGEAIGLALALGAQGILLDDRKARRLAQREGLLVVGTLGVLDAAASRGLIDLPRTVEELQATNFRVDERLVQSLLGR